MNLILFAADELARPLPRADRRARHLTDVLRRSPGDTFDAGLIGGPRGKGTLVAATPDALTLAFAWGPPLPPTPAITLVVGLPRPQTARDILRDATTLGAAAVHFVRTEKAEPSYAQSSLWHDGEWQRHVLAGAEQAFDPRVPTVTHGRTLAEALADLPPPAAAPRLALDNYEAAAALGGCNFTADQGAVLAIGAERGWSAAERTLLRTHGFTLAHLGERVLRSETAVVAALAIVRGKLGLM